MVPNDAPEQQGSTQGQTADQTQQPAAAEQSNVTPITAAKRKTEVEKVTLSDGRVAEFAGKRRMNKETLLDPEKVQYDEQSGAVLLAPGAVSVRFDFRDGSTRTYPAPLKLAAKLIGHGMEQKYGDELASPADKPMDFGDMTMALDDLDKRLQGGDWSVAREGSGGFSGASVVIQAIIRQKKADEGKDLTVEAVKTFLEAKLEAHKNDTPPLTRQRMYASFRANPKLEPHIKAIEAERNAAKPADVEKANEMLAELG